MRRTFDIDVLAGPQCGGRLRLIATVEDPDAIRAMAALATCRERANRAPPYAPAPDTRHAAVIGAWTHRTPKPVRSGLGRFGLPQVAPCAARNPLTARLSVLFLGAQR